MIASNTTKILLTLFFCSLEFFVGAELTNHLAKAQTIFSQDFELGMAPMTVVDVDMQPPAAQVANLQGKWIAFASSDGNGTVIAAQSSWYDPAGASDDWMITPSIAIPDSNAIIRWEAKAPNPSFRDGYQVLISTTDNSIASFTDTLFEVDDEFAEWETRLFSLDEYIGQSIFIAFRNNSNDDDVLFVDNIWVGIPSADDAELLVVDIGCPSPPGSRQVSVNINNKGINTITSLDISYNFNGLMKTESLSNLNIGTGEVYNFTFPQPINMELGADQKITASLTNINGNDDPIPEDNADSLSFEVVESVKNIQAKDTDGVDWDLFNELQNGKPIIIDFFASWCTPCEISTPALNSMYVNNGADQNMQVLGLSVEPNDTDETVKGLNWGATYPKFKYYQESDDLFFHYADDHCLNDENFLPFFVMICPNSPDGKPENSAIVRADDGYEVNMFSNFYQQKLDECLEEITAVQDLEELVSDIKLSPNPTSGKLLLEFFLEETQALELNIFNSTGQLLAHQNLGKVNGYFNYPINTEDFANGFYWISLSANDKVLSRKFVVSR